MSRIALLDTWTGALRKAYSPVPLGEFGAYSVTLKKGNNTYDTVNFTLEQCPKPPKTPTIDVYVEPCMVPGGEPSDTVWVSLGKLQKGKTYIVEISYYGETISTQKVHADGHTAEFAMPVAGAGDYYTATVSQKWSEDSASIDFSVPPCPPPDPVLTIAGAGGQCVALGGVGTVLVTIGGLVPERTYEVTLWFGDELVGTQYVDYPESESAELTFEVESFGEYTATVVSGIEIMPLVMTSLANYGDYGDYDEYPWPEDGPWFDQSATVTFQAGDECPLPPEPVTPAMAKPLPPKLIETGVAGPGDGSGIIAAVLLLTLGGALVAATQIGRVRRSR